MPRSIRELASVGDNPILLATHLVRAKTVLMRKTGWSLCLLGMFLLAAHGQVSVEVTLPQQQFLPGEAIPAAVRITNRSGQTLHLGEDDAWLTFSIDSRDNFVVEKLGDPPVQGAFELASAEIATKRVDLNPYFTIGQPGRYQIIANVHIKDWNRDVASTPKTFDLVMGARLWEQDFGLPATNAAPEVRKYILQQVNYLKGQLRLYLRVTDAAGGKIFRVVAVGNLLSFSRPEPQIDGASNLHLLYQSGPNAYTYCVFNPDGELTLRQTYDIVDVSRPRLRTGTEGKIAVGGGLRRVTPSDIPAPDPNQILDDAPPLSLYTNRMAQETNRPTGPAAPTAVPKQPKK
jgi:hypothetical protein